MYTNLLNLAGRVAVVTGGGRSIGLECCRALGEFGAHIVIADWDLAEAERGKSVLDSEGISSEFVELNVAESTRVTTVAADLIAKHGKIDILVNNAGIVKSGIPATETTDELWQEHLDVLLHGLFYATREFGRDMLKHRSGSIVNIGSMSGCIVNWPQAQSFYNVAKAGVHQLTKSLAVEWANRGVRVNAVAPTYIQTPLTDFAWKENPDMYKVWMDMTPMGRMGQTTEVASAVAFLASDAASYVTGEVLLTDAGYTVW